MSDKGTYLGASQNRGRALGGIDEVANEKE